MDIVNRMLWENTFKDSSIEDIVPTVREICKNKDSNYITSTLDCMVALDLEKTKLQGIADVIEELFLTSKDMGYLCKYLFLIYHRIGNVSLARFYLDLCHNDLGTDNEFTKAAFFYSLNPLQELSNNYHQNNFSRDYCIGGRSFSYSVFSFSDEIGPNMTLLKTRFGSIIFDCGAKCSVDSAIMISIKDLEDFLSATETKKEDVKAIIISHAHLDHYGSLNTIIDAGFDIKKIFMSDGTKKLISAVTHTTLPLAQIRPISEFFVANNDIKIKSFVNGHIVGSECYLVSFDNINIIYSGDYCLHDQRTVKGLNPVLINNEDAVKTTDIDCLITESTYGHSQQYLKHNDAENALVHFVDKLLNMGYKVFLPSFAVGRSQELALILNERHSVLLDGLAITVSQIYENISGIAIYNKNTRYNVETAEDRKRNFDANNIIIASSGMLAKNSTSYNYVKSFLHSGEKIAIIKTGFINSESFGKSLLDEWKSEDNILLDISLSAHASYDEIIALINELNPRNIVSIHGKGIAHVDAVESNSVLIETLPSGTLEKGDNDTVADEFECENDEIEDLIYSPIKGMGKESIIEESVVDSKSQDERIQISDSQCRGKLDNVYKAGKSLHDNGISLQKSPSFLTACKLALRFLKLNPYYEKVYAYLSNIKNHEEFWNYIADGVEHDYGFKAEEPLRPTIATNDTLKTEQTINDDFALSNVERENESISYQTGFEKDYKIQSDIMIVKMSENDYYVSEKIHGGIPYFKLLESRSHTSNHFYTLEAAKDEADRLRKMILSTSPNCEIVELDIENYSKTAKSFTDIKETYVDNDGQVIFGVTTKGKLRILSSEEDNQYVFIDKRTYRKKLYEKIDNYAQNLECDYRKMGFELAYRVALGMSLSNLRFEIYKAKELIKSFEWDNELFAYDRLLYEAYIEGITDSIKIQKECLLMPKDWDIYILDLSADNDIPHLNQYGSIYGIGTYKIILCKKGEPITISPKDNSILVVIIDNDTDRQAVIDEYKINSNWYFTFDVPKSKNAKKRFGNRIEDIVSAIFRLNGDSDYYGIAEEWVDALIPYLENDEYGYDNIQDDLRKEYIRIVQLLFNNPHAVVYKDFNTLKSMCTRCVRKDKKDWQTTYMYLGYPDEDTLNSFIRDSKMVRNLLREGIYDDVQTFVSEYKDILLYALNMMTDTDQKIDETKQCLSIEAKENECSKLGAEQEQNNCYAETLSSTAEGAIIEEKRNGALNISIEQLDFSIRTYNCLHRARILNVKQLSEMTEDQLYKVRNLGKKGVDEIKGKLGELCLKLQDRTNFEFENFPVYERIKNDDFKIEGNILVKYLGTAENVIIPQGIRAICGGAFHENKTVKSIFLPNGVEVVGKAAFYDCSSLTDISLPNTLKKIEDYAFFSCESLTAIQFPYKLVKIGERAFNQCKALTSIEIPDSVETIGSMAFTQCKQLGKVFIGNGVRSIGEYAFSSCKNLNYVKLPEKLETIERGVFRGCHRLTTIIFPQTIRTIGEKAFNNVGFVCCDIPYGVEEIGPQAFYASQELEMIRIPKTIKIINANAFGHLIKLKTVIFDGSESEWVKIEKGDDLFIRSLTDKVQFQ